MKIENKVLKNYVEQIRLSDRVNECVFSFDDMGMSVRVKSPDQIVFVENKLVKTAFASYDNFGDLAIENLKNFKKFLDRFGDDLIEITKEENKLVVDSNNRKGEFILASTEFIKGETKSPNLQYENVLKINANVLKEATLSADALNEKLVRIEIKDVNKETFLVVTTGSTNKITDTVKLKEKYSACNATFGDALSDCMKFMNDEITVKLATDMPITLEQKTDTSKFMYVIAPYVE